jgi:hypothetical protein
MKGGGKGDGTMEAVAKRRSGRAKWCKGARENQQAAGKGST